MDQLSLLFIVSALTGVFSSRWALRLAPPLNELPLKLMLATGVLGILAARLFVAYTLPYPVVAVTGLVACLYVYSPILLTSLGRARRYGAADSLAQLLFWSSEGRYAVRRLIAQVALQQGDPAAVLKLVEVRDADPLLLAQVYAAQQDWQRVLAVELDETGGDNLALGVAARVEALLALGQEQAAEDELARLQARFDAQPGAITYRSLNLSKARLAAERGNLTRVQDLLSSADGTAPHLLFAVAARAAEQAGSRDNAVRLYKQAYAVAPAAQRARYTSKLDAYGEPLPELVNRQHTPLGTYALAGVLAAAYALQLWVSGAYSLAAATVPLTVPNQYGMSAAQVLAGFTLNIPDVPSAGALWRYLSYGFLHGGIVHLGFNLWVLFDIGRLYESRRGWGNLLAAFVFGTALGAYLTLLAEGNEIRVLVGASGGILGVAGALLADTWRSSSARDKQLTRSLVQWMVIIVLFSFAVPGVSLWGHVGGLVGGLLWGFARQGLGKVKAVDTAAGALSILTMAYALSQVGALFLELF